MKFAVRVSLTTIVMFWSISFSASSQAAFTDDADTQALWHMDQVDNLNPDGGFQDFIDDDNTFGAPDRPNGVELALGVPGAATHPTFVAGAGPDGSGALEFDGVDDVGTATGAWLGATNNLTTISLDVQVKPTNFPTDGSNLIHVVGPLSWRLWWRSIDAPNNIGRFDFWVLNSAGDDWTFLNSQNVALNEWHDVHAQLDSNGRVELKVDSWNSTTQLVGGFNQTDSLGKVGQDIFNEPGRYFGGTIDEVRIASAPVAASSAGGVLFADTFDGTDIQDFVGQSGTRATLAYATSFPGAGGITEASGTLTLDAAAFAGATDFSPADNFNLAEIEAAGGFIVEMTDVNPIDNAAGAPTAEGTVDSWVGVTLFESAGGNGNPLESAYSFALRDNGESFVIADDLSIVTFDDTGAVGGTHDIRVEVSITDFSSSGSATIEAYVDDVLSQTTVLSGLDLSNNHIFFRGVDGISTVGGISIRLPGTPGDFDADGDVDGSDFLLWQRDQSVGDLADWQNNYGSGSSVEATASAVPEPASAMLVLLGLGILSVAPRRRHK